jgi:hypothetical protein
LKSQGLPVGLAAVDCDNPRTALGQKPQRRSTDDPGRAGDDSDLAVQTDSTGHFQGFPLARPVMSGFVRVSAPGRAAGRNYSMREAG